MRKLIGLIISLVILVIGAALVVPFLIPLDSYKKQAETRLSEMTGRDIRVEGDARLKLFPNISIVLNKVFVGNPVGYKTPYLAQIESLDLQVALQPLFQKKVDVKRLVLVKPDVNLEVNANGKPNWQIDFNAPKLPKLGASLSIISDANASEAAPAKAQSFSVNNVNLSGFSVDGGKLTYIEQSGSKQQIDALDIEAEAVAISKPLDIKSSFKWNGLDFDVLAKAASLKELMEQKPTSVALKLKSQHLVLTYNGKASPAGIKGKIDVNSPSIVSMMKWLGKPMDWKNTPLSIAANGDIQCTTSQCALGGANIAIDALKFNGDIAAAFSGKPTIKGNLTTNRLDLTPYMAAAEKQASNSFIFGDAYAAAGHWDATPLDLSGLNAMNVDVQLAAAELIAPPWQAKDNKIHLIIQNGAASINILQSHLLGGTVKGVLKASGARNVSASCDLNAAGVNIESLLKILNNDDRLSGNANLNIAANASGSSLASMVNTLDGNGSIKILNGAIKGINLAEMARNVKSAFTGQARGSQQTDFAELGGTFTIANGVISNDDLAMKSPYIRLSGKGTIDLPAYQINYRLVPKIVDTSKGQGGADNRVGIDVPIIVSGALDNPQFTPDLQSMVTDALQNKEKLKETVKDIKAIIKENKTDVKQQIKDIKQVVKDPKDILKDPEKLNQLGDMLNQFR